MTPRIITVSMVKNEERIIESSVRWWMTFSDQILLFDHHSTDRTPKILTALKEEYNQRLSFFRPDYNTTDYLQAKITNGMIELAFNEYGADLLLPLDADEFPCLKAGNNDIRSFLNSLDPNLCYSTFWIPYAPLRPDETIDPSRFLPLSFRRRRKTPLPQFPKVIIGKKTFQTEHLFVSKGNHSLFTASGDSLAPKSIRTLWPELYYAHYMFLDPEHFRRKCVSNWKACVRAPDYQPGIAEHYRLACEKISAGLADDSYAEYCAISVSGLTGESPEKIRNNIEDTNPAEIYGNIDLKYTV